MSSALVIDHITAQQALEYKKQLTQDGLVVNNDYSWKYQPIKYNDWSMSPKAQHSFVEFEFVDPALATFYRLKWAR